MLGLLAATVLGTPAPLQAATLSLSASQARTQLPAADLRRPGESEVLSPGRALELRQQNEDLSRYDPEPNDLWDPQAPVGATLFPTASESTPPTLNFESVLPSAGGLLRARVLDLQNPQNARGYHLNASLLSHGALARLALLRKLGYPLTDARWYPRLRLKFSSKAERDSFLDRLSDATLTARNRWLAEPLDTSAENEALLQDIVLEPAQLDAPRVQWGILTATAVENRRASRALLVALTLLDLPESANAFSWEFSKRVGESVLLTHPFAESFITTTWDDARWVARKIGALTRDDLREVLQAGAFPADVTALLTEKFIARRNQLLQLFDLAPELPRAQREFSYDRKISRGAVKEGKLTQSQYLHYAVRFTFGDPQSPLRFGEILRYLAVESISTALDSLLGLINSELLQIRSPSDVAQAHQTAVRDALAQAAANPNAAPQARPIGVWGGPVMGGNVQASRHVLTGTYYGSDARVQLVDSVGVSAQVGFFAGVDGIKGVFPSLGANLFVSRNYVHVRPISEMKRALRSNWLDLWVPRFFHRFDELLKTGDPSASGDAAAALQKLADAMEEGEMFIIGDTIGVSAGAGVSIPLPLLLDLGVGVFSPSLSFSLGTQPALLRRVILSRTADGLQVTLQNSRSISFEVGMSFNWVIQLASATLTEKLGMAESRAFELNLANLQADRKPALLRSLRALFRQNSGEILESEFPHYVLNHRTRTEIQTGRVLAWSVSRLEENHRLRIAPPGHPEAERQFTSFRIWSSGGSSVTPLLSDIAGLLSRGALRLGSSSDLNPSSGFLGSGAWNIAMAEAETTPKRRSPTVARIEHHWGGWYMRRKELFELFDQIDEKMKLLALPRSLVRRDVFEDLKTLQLYDVAATLVVYEAGLAKLGEAILRPRTLRETFEGLVDIEGRESFQAWCREPWHAVLAHTLFVDNFVGSEDGKAVRIKCVRPWMKEMLKLRTELRSWKQPTESEEQLKWTARALRLIEQKIDYATLLRWLGPENATFQLKVSGFRTKDENGDSEYVSDVIGSLRSAQETSPFRALSEQTGIPYSEVSGRYLSDGY